MPKSRVLFLDGIALVIQLLFLNLGLAPVIVSTINPEDTEAIFRSTEKYPNRPGMDAVIIGRHDNNLHEGVANVQGEEWYQVPVFHANFY